MDTVEFPSSPYKTDAELDALPTQPWIFGMGDVVVEENAAPLKPEWLYKPIFRNPNLNSSIKNTVKISVSDNM